MAGRYKYALGTTPENMVYLFQMGVKAPLQTFRPYSKIIEDAAGGTVGQGRAGDEWLWNVITDAQRAQLRAYCPGASADVYVWTLDDSLATPAWKLFRGKMRWNQISEDRQSNSRLKLSLSFVYYEDVTPS